MRDAERIRELFVGINLVQDLEIFSMHFQTYREEMRVQDVAQLELSKVESELLLVQHELLVAQLEVLLARLTPSEIQ